MFLPIRHHSPACARFVREAILRLRPAVVLIEGPAEFNDRIEELYLPHQLPLAIYSYVGWDDGRRQGAYYPFCDYSPEWQAILAAREIKACVRFIDLPYAIVARDERSTHRYADGRLGSSDYVQHLTSALQVENFNDAWDLIAEQPEDLSCPAMRDRIDHYCRHLRLLDKDCVSPHDIAREQFMAQHIRAGVAEFGRDKIIVITGGYHTVALEALLGHESDQTDQTDQPEIRWPQGMKERGIALTPYSYQRLDALKGYDAGMPSPGFYEASWQAGQGEFHSDLLRSVAKRLRDLNQSVSTADLVAVSTTAQALASLRGHPRVWRRDLIDGVVAALVKDDLHAAHPLLLELYAVLRGERRGCLAPGSPQPPLVIDIQEKLAQNDLTPEMKVKSRTLELAKVDDLKTSRLLHQLRVLGVPGVVRSNGVDFAQRDDLTQLSEEWQVRWAVEQDASMIEASRYGSALEEAVAACLAEMAEGIERRAEKAVLLLLDAVLAGIFRVADSLRDRVAAVIHEDGDLGSVARAMRHLLYLYCWDDALGSRGTDETGRLLAECFGRGVWLLEYGSATPSASEEVLAVGGLRDAFERAEHRMGLERAYFIDVLRRVQADNERSPAQRGACAGALWSLAEADPADIRRDLLLFAQPEKLGDFLTGLFTLARETAQRDVDLLSAIHDVLLAWDEEGFLTALPSLRLAFMSFTAREKFYLANTLFGETMSDTEPVPLQVSASEATAAMAFEAEIMALATRYGINLEVT